MKKVTSIILLLFISVVVVAVNPNGDKILQKIKSENKETFSISFSKNMIDFFDMDVDFNGKEKLITGDFKEANMLVLEKEYSTKEIRNVFEKEKYKLVISETEEENSDNVYLYVDRNGNKVSEAHFLVEDEDSIIIVTVYGDINVKNK